MLQPAQDGGGVGRRVDDDALAAWAVRRHRFSGLPSVAWAVLLAGFTVVAFMAA